MTRLSICTMSTRRPAVARWGVGFRMPSGIVAPHRGVGGPRGGVCDVGLSHARLSPDAPPASASARAETRSNAREASMGAMRTGVLLVGLALTLSLATAAAAQPLSGPEYIALDTPCRALDTRLTGTPIPANMPTTIQIGGVTTGGANCGVPLTAVAAALNFTITEPQGRGHMVAWPSGPLPATSVVNFDPGEDVANAVDIGLGAGGTVLVQSIVATHLVVDIYGYFTDVEELGNEQHRPGRPRPRQQRHGPEQHRPGRRRPRQQHHGQPATPPRGSAPSAATPRAASNTATGVQRPRQQHRGQLATPPRGSAPSAATPRAAQQHRHGGRALGSNSAQVRQQSTPPASTIPPSATRRCRTTSRQRQYRQRRQRAPKQHHGQREYRQW